MAEALGFAPLLISIAAQASSAQALLESMTNDSHSIPGYLSKLIENLSTFRHNLDTLVAFFVRQDRPPLSSRGTQDMKTMLQTSADILQEVLKYLQSSHRTTNRKARKEMTEKFRGLQENNHDLLMMITVLHLAEGSAIRKRSSSINRFTGPRKPDGHDESSKDHVGAYLKKLGSRHRRYFNKFSFERKPVFHISTRNSDGVPGVDNFDHGSLRSNDVMRAAGTEPRGVEAMSSSGLTLILCDATTDNSVPFDQETLVAIMERFKFPHGLFQALFTGTPKFVVYHAKDSDQRASLVLRTPISMTENWTLTLSWDSSFRDLSGIMHGVEPRDAKRLADYIGDTRPLIEHPMTVPILLCEILIERDSDGIKMNASNLHQVEKRTNFHGYVPSTRVVDGTTIGKSAEQDFSEMTRSLNLIISRFAFHELRMHANMAFVDAMAKQLDGLDTAHSKVHSRDEEADSTGGAADKQREGDEEYLHGRLSTISRALHERLVHLRTEQSALLLEISCNQKIAQSQLEIVYNLVAQRDNKDNLEMATTQTEIANTTKEDSFAMRTIAVMSIFFLPGTFVSSFFSMDMFDWQAPNGASIVSSRFWIYWAVTVPLTLIVFSIWFVWLQSHHKHETRRSRRNNTLNTGVASDTPESLQVPPKRPWIRSKWATMTHRDVEKQHVEVMASEQPTSAEGLTSALRSRTPQVQIDRANTVLQGPAR